MFSKLLYVQVRKNQFDVRNLANARTVRRSADPGFSHPRMLVGNFTAAQRCLKAALSEARGGGLALVTRVVMHPMETVDGGLTEVEERLFQELALSAGASKVVVWVGAPLSDTEVTSKAEGG